MRANYHGQPPALDARLGRASSAARPAHLLDVDELQAQLELERQARAELMLWGGLALARAGIFRDVACWAVANLAEVLAHRSPGYVSRLERLAGLT